MGQEPRSQASSQVEVEKEGKKERKRERGMWDKFEDTIHKPERDTLLLCSFSLSSLSFWFFLVRIPMMMDESPFTDPSSFSFLTFRNFLFRWSKYKICAIITERCINKDVNDASSHRHLSFLLTPLQFSLFPLRLLPVLCRVYHTLHNRIWGYEMKRRWLHSLYKTRLYFLLKVTRGSESMEKACFLSNIIIKRMRRSTSRTFFFLFYLYISLSLHFNLNHLHFASWLIQFNVDKRMKWKKSSWKWDTFSGWYNSNLIWVSFTPHHGRACQGCGKIMFCLSKTPSMTRGRI